MAVERTMHGIRSEAFATIVTPMIREQRDAVRADLQRDVDAINRMLEEGWRITHVDYVVEVDGGGYFVTCDLERDGE